MIAITGCVLLGLLMVLGGSLVKAKTEQGPSIDHFTDVLAARGVACVDGQFWSVPPKGQSTLNCDEFEIDVFNNNAEVSKFLRWKEKPQDARFLRRTGQGSYIVRGSTWVLFTPSKRAASEFESRVGGRLLTVSH